MVISPMSVVGLASCLVASSALTLKPGWSEKEMQDYRASKEMNTDYRSMKEQISYGDSKQLPSLPDMLKSLNAASDKLKSSSILGSSGIVLMSTNPPPANSEQTASTSKQNSKPNSFIDNIIEAGKRASASSPQSNTQQPNTQQSNTQDPNKKPKDDQSNNRSMTSDDFESRINQIYESAMSDFDKTQKKITSNQLTVTDDLTEDKPKPTQSKMEPKATESKMEPKSTQEAANAKAEAQEEAELEKKKKAYKRQSPPTTNLAAGQDASKPKKSEEEAKPTKKSYEENTKFDSFDQILNTVLAKVGISDTDSSKKDTSAGQETKQAKAEDKMVDSKPFTVASKQRPQDSQDKIEVNSINLLAKDDFKIGLEANLFDVMTTNIKKQDQSTLFQSGKAPIVNKFGTDPSSSQDRVDKIKGEADSISETFKKLSASLDQWTPSHLASVSNLRIGDAQK